MKAYKPWSAKALSWEEIENSYIKNWQGAHLYMLALVRHIRSSNLVNRLYGSTSMDKLVISLYDPLDYRNESLHITFSLHTNKWYFEYWALPSGGYKPSKPEYVRIYNAELGIEKFDNFIKMIKW